MTQALSLLNTAIAEAEYIFRLLFLRMGAFTPYMAGLTIVLVVRFLLMPIVGSLKVGSDQVRKSKSKGSTKKGG